MKKHVDDTKYPGAYVPTYCPLNLYSYEPERVKKALYALWNDWAQNLIGMWSSARWELRRGLRRLRKGCIWRIASRRKVSHDTSSSSTTRRCLGRRGRSSSFLLDPHISFSESYRILMGTVRVSLPYSSSTQFTLRTLGATAQRCGHGDGR